MRVAARETDRYGLAPMPDPRAVNSESDVGAVRPGRRRAPWGLVLGLLFFTVIGMLAAIYFVVMSGKL